MPRQCSAKGDNRFCLCGSRRHHQEQEQEQEKSKSKDGAKYSGDKVCPSRRLPSASASPKTLIVSVKAWYSPSLASKDEGF